MSMWISKNLGGGFRIGTSIRTTPTQAELSRMAKFEFIARVKQRMNIALEKYSMQNGYYLTGRNKWQVLNINEEISGKIKPYVMSFKDVMRLIDDGGNLTEKRKEALLRAVYGVEDLLISKNELYVLKCKFDAAKDTSILCLPLLLFFSSLLIHSFHFMDVKGKSILWLLSNIFIITAYFFLKKDRLSKVIREIKEKSLCPVSNESLGYDVTWKDFIVGTISFFILLISFVVVKTPFKSDFVQDKECVVCGKEYVTHYQGIPLMDIDMKTLEEGSKYMYNGDTLGGLKKWILKNTDDKFFHVLQNKDGYEKLDGQLDKCSRVVVLSIFNDEFIKSYNYFVNYGHISKKNAISLSYANALMVLKGLMENKIYRESYLKSIEILSKENKEYKRYIGNDYINFLETCLKSGEVKPALKKN